MKCHTKPLPTLNQNYSNETVASLVLLKEFISVQFCSERNAVSVCAVEFHITNASHLILNTSSVLLEQVH